MNGQFELPLFLDYGATLLWALTGALVAARRGYDYAGVFALALVSATGGGLLRDGLFLQTGPPLLVRTPTYIALVLGAALLVIWFGAHAARTPYFETAALLLDGIGLGAYGIVGMQLSLAAGLSVPGAVLVGTINAVGGGLLRDVLMRREPEIFQPGLPTATTAIACCGVFLALTRLGGAGITVSAWVAIAVAFAMRALAVRFRLHTRPLRGFEGRGEP